MSEPPVKPVVNSATLDKAISDLTDILIEEEICNIILNRGKHLRYNTVDHVAYFAEIQPGTEQVESPILDIFGQVLHKKSNFECECPKCHRTLAAARFAPHLEKCMGMGRNSSRIASRRLAASASSSCNSSSSTSIATGNAGGSDMVRSSAVATNVSSIAGAQLTGMSDVVSEDEHFEQDDGDDDEDWTMDRKKKKKAVEKSAPKRIK